jgi:anti-anti-sigma factor
MNYFRLPNPAACRAAEEMTQPADRTVSEENMEFSRMDDGVACLNGDLHIADAEALRSVLLSELAAAPELVLDASGVDSCDTASFQLLCSLRKSAERDGKVFRISALSAAMRDASAILGLSPEDLNNATKK